ncbi:phospho-sugar mutase [Athalassotoga saccharophila]|uniref:phospho-sugar mutase n=1 Tax=Athalassotoga saccharophila TaxID=1441386 RepID=UPI00137AA2A1|nr:phospho-sugar mutase [Athalassotoga saccharophila]BBJ28577.1 phosphoglucomutase [Athalassotoga saccharophila]
MDKESMERYQSWLNDPAISSKDKETLKKMNQDELQDAFYKDLEFGTGGMRGIMGLGANRMNIYTVGRATQALANYINKNVNGPKSVAISYDTRNMSKDFAMESAEILAANGIKVYLVDDFRPTPVLSFAVRYFKTTAGIMITASHNPPQYNGYKAYWSNGAQVIPPYDEGIIKEYELIKSFAEIKKMPFENARKKSLINLVGNELDEAYFKKALSYSFHISSKDLKIVYTPLHGTGMKIVPILLQRDGFEFYVQREQGIPDGNFPTVNYPNPEFDEAFKLSIEDAKRLDADIIVASDPDADRMGVMVKDHGKYVRIDGNQMGSLLLHFILEMYSKKGMPSNPAVIESIVSSKLFAKIAKSYGVEVHEVLTGFKWICNEADMLRSKGKNVFFAYEESYGYNIGDFIYDKDSGTPIMVTCEMATYYKQKGMTLVDAMEEIYKKYGYYLEDQLSPVFEGESGVAKIKHIMESLRKTPPKKIGGYSLTNFVDYLKGQDHIPPSDVIKMEFGDRVVIYGRPSGTEPKVKFYFMIMNMENLEGAKKLIKNVKDEFSALLKSIEE